MHPTQIGRELAQRWLQMPAPQPIPGQDWRELSRAVWLKDTHPYCLQYGRRFLHVGSPAAPVPEDGFREP